MSAAREWIQDRILALCNQLSRAIRLLKFLWKKKCHPDWPLAVSEGDSWFQLPFVSRDIIDNLYRQMAIRSIGAGGATFKAVIKQNEICDALDATKAEILFLSAGGNDFVIDDRLVELVHPYSPNLNVPDYPTDVCTQQLDALRAGYASLITHLLCHYPNLKIFVHGYDRAIPRCGGRYLGKPLCKLGLPQAKQREVFAHLIDLLNDVMRSLDNDYPQVFYVDCTGALDDNQWWRWDEMHPTNEGFRLITNRFLEQLRDAGVNLQDIPEPTRFENARTWFGTGAARCLPPLIRDP